jgi:hypothetical protein
MSSAAVCDAQIATESRKRKRVQFEETHCELSVPAVWGRVEEEETDDTEVFVPVERVCVTKTTDGVSAVTAATTKMLEHVKGNRKITVREVEEIMVSTSALDKIQSVSSRIESMIDRMETTNGIVLLPSTEHYGAKFMPALEFLRSAVRKIEEQQFVANVWAEWV